MIQPIFKNVRNIVLILPVLALSENASRNKSIFIHIKADTTVEIVKNNSTNAIWLTKAKAAKEIIPKTVITIAKK
jgi:hypothetical protein